MGHWKKGFRTLIVLGLTLGLLGLTGIALAEEPAKDAAPAAPGVMAPPAPAGATAAATPAPPKPDPGGAATGGVGDIPAKTAGKPTLDEIADTVGHNKIAINIVWTLVAGFLVMFMQAGFALAETGLTRAKNASHTMMMNFMVYALGMTGYWIVGFALQMGGVGGVGSLAGGTVNLSNEFTLTLFGKEFGLFGTTGFFLTGVAYDAAVFALFLFQMVFMDTAATIPTGAMAERWKFSSFCVFAFFISMVTYPLFGNWVWGGGWLSQLGKNFGLGHGYIDFAGSSVVHMTGGVTALAGAMVLGPRLGKFNQDGSPNALPAHNIPMALTGVFILAFGWFGFNAGSTLAGTDLRIGVVATNTMLASASGAIAAMLYMWLKYGKPDPSMAGNGMLAGLVAITAPCAFVNSVSAFTIGAVAGWLVCLSVFFVERTLKVDDPVGAVSVHGTCGAWGVVALGIFADGTYGDAFNGVQGTVRGLLYGDAGQLVAQIIGPLTNLVFIFGASWAFFKLCDMVMGLRVAPEVEIEGLDLPEMGALAYPDFSLVPSHSGGSSMLGGGTPARGEAEFVAAKRPQTV
jgi:Amt family ammonium transporter